MPRFGKDKDARKEELDRQAAEEVERLTRRAGPPGMGGGMGGPGAGPRIGIPSPLEQIADELRDAPPPSQRRPAPPRRPAPQQQAQAFTPMPSGSVGSSFGPGGLNPGPRMAATAPPPPAFGGGAYDEDYGGPVTGPPVYNAEPDEDEEMSITEMALMDHAARTGHNPEDLVMQYDATSAEDMRDQAMRQFYERQQSRPGGQQTNNPFAPAGMRRSGPAAAPSRPADPATAGGALAQRLANRRRREAEEAGRSGGAPAASDSSAAAALARSKPKIASRPAGRAAPAEPADDDGALAKLLARRRQALAVDEPDEAPAPLTAPPGPRHAQEREEASPGMRVVPLEPVTDDEPPARAPARKAPARKAAAKKAGPTKKAVAVAVAEAAPPPAKTPARKATKAGATLAPTAPPAKKAPAKNAAAKKKAPAKKKPAGKNAAPAAGTRAAPKSVFCIECGKKNPAIAKFCFNCGTRLAAPEG